jgi:protein SCO1/2
MHRYAPFVIAALAGLVLGALGFHFYSRPAPGPALPPGGDFTLESADGPVALERLRGQVVLIYFGYAACPDVCPTALALTTQGLMALTPDELARVRVLFVSVDPERDTLAHLKQYAGYFHPNITGVTGSHAALAAVTARYGAAYRRTEVTSAAGYVVDHTSVTTVVAPDGRLVEQLIHGTPPDEVAAAIRRWLPR